MTTFRVPHWVGYIDDYTGVTVETECFESSDLARDWVRETLGADALDDGRAWLVPAVEPVEVPR
jgi:hypothetical protein